MAWHGKALGWIIRMWAHEIKRNSLADPRFKGKLTIDHIVPKTKGGPHCIGNVQGLPRRVNVMKSELLPEELMNPKTTAQRLAKDAYLEYTHGVECVPCQYECSACPFNDYLGDMAYEYSAWVPEADPEP